MIRTRPKVKEVKEMEEVKEVKEEGRRRKKARKKTTVKKKGKGRREKRKARRAGSPLIHPNSRSPAPGGCILNCKNGKIPFENSKDKCPKVVGLGRSGSMLAFRKGKIAL